MAHSPEDSPSWWGSHDGWSGTVPERPQLPTQVHSYPKQGSRELEQNQGAAVILKGWFLVAYAIAFQSSTSSWGPSIQIGDPVGDISHPNCNCDLLLHNAGQGDSLVTACVKQMNNYASCLGSTW